VAAMQDKEQVSHPACASLGYLKITWRSREPY